MGEGCVASHEGEQRCRVERLVMGTSFVEMNGHGFWARDDKLALFLTLLFSDLMRDEEITPHQVRGLRKLHLY